MAGRDDMPVPYSFDITGNVADKLVRHYGITDGDVHKFIGDCLLYTGCGNADGFDPSTGDPSLQRDEFGTVWLRDKGLREIGDWGGIREFPLKEPRLGDYKFPDPNDPGRYRHMRADWLTSSDRYVILASNGLFDVCWHLRGFEEFLMDMAYEKAFVNGLLDRILEYNLAVISNIPDTVDGIRFGEDWGQQDGMLMGKPYWEEYLKPRLRKMYGLARSRGFDVFIHSCGDISAVFGDLADMGVQVVNPVQPEVMDVAFLKREYGRDLTLYGALGSQSTIPHGTPAEVVDEAKRMVELLGKGGGYIMGPAGAIPAEASVENVSALVDYAMSLS